MASPLTLQSSRTATIDRLREEHASALRQAVGVVGFALLTVLCAQVRVYVWEVPISLNTLAVYGSGLYLGWRNGFLAQLLYVALGFFVPVYAGDGTGLTYFHSAVSAGYLLGYPFAAAVIGLLSKRWKAFGGSVMAMIAGSFVLFTCGVVWLHYAAGHASWFTSLDRGFLRFVLIDLAKILVIGAMYSGSRQL